MLKRISGVSKSLRGFSEAFQDVSVDFRQLSDTSWERLLGFRRVSSGEFMLT